MQLIYFDNNICHLLVLPDIVIFRGANQTTQPSYLIGETNIINFTGNFQAILFR
jgi:hypothetical protein